MIKAFVDSDIIIDLLTKREPHFYESAKLLQYCHDKKICLCTTPLAIANVHYIVRKSKGEKLTREVIKKLLSFIEVTNMNKASVAHALDSDMKDFEDAMQTKSAKLASCSFLITRNIRDYKKSELEARTPQEVNTLITKA